MGKSERIEFAGNRETMNFNEILYQNVLGSQYFRNLQCVARDAGRMGRRGKQLTPARSRFGGQGRWPLAL